MWPVTLNGENIQLRAPRMADRAQWNRVRAENREWLSPWEATLPQTPVGAPASEFLSKRPSYYSMVRALNREARAGRSYSFMIWHGKNLVGQITLGGVIYGALRGGHIGYWIDKNYAGRGFTTEAVNAVTSFAFDALGLHRIEINIRPENSPSIRVAEKAGYQFEGDRSEFLHIAGAWRDHKSFVKVNDLIK
jgi:ribosomal-protein-alanine N-acetyltransferase